jgi:lipoprotein NlpD
MLYIKHKKKLKNNKKALITTLMLFGYILLLNNITGCSTNKNTAPVVNITQGNSANERVKHPINHSKYKVKRGETLYTIAWRANSDVRTIANINNIRPPYRIYPNQVLYLTPKKSDDNSSKGYTKNSNVSSNKKGEISQNNDSKKIVASNKKQAYGENVDNKTKKKQNTGSKAVFSQKIRRWQWPTKGKVISKFSSTAQGNKGIDIAGRRSQNIKAAAKGKVVYVGEALRGYGKLVIVKHNEDYLSAYAHNDKILVKEKQQVNVGDVIAKMGDSGTNKVMLHFEVRFRGKSVNPLKYLPK